MILNRVNSKFSLNGWKGFNRNMRRFFSSTETATRPEPQVASSLLQIGTRSIFTYEHDMYREMVRRFYVDHVIPYHDKWEEDGQVDRQVWKKAAEQGKNFTATYEFVRVTFYALSYTNLSQACCALQFQRNTEVLVWIYFILQSAGKNSLTLILPALAGFYIAK
jgi:hypothetical protein